MDDRLAGKGFRRERDVLAPRDARRRPRGDRGIDDIVRTNEPRVEAVRQLDPSAGEQTQALALTVPGSFRERERLARQHSERHLRMDLVHARITYPVDVEDRSLQR